MQRLAEKTPAQREGALAVARAALEAREFETARKALNPYLAAPTQRVAALMAEIEQAEHGDTGRMREWMSRAVRASGDPVWTAEGVVSDHWLPLTPSGRLDGYEWRVPLAEIGVTRPVIEIAPEPAQPPVPSPEQEPEDGTVREPIAAEPDMHVAKTSAPVDAAAEPPSGPRGADDANRTPHVEPVIPLMHAPDDPGPDGAIVADVEREPAAPVESRGWQKIKDLFR
jgi:HemY protein